MPPDHSRSQSLSATKYLPYEAQHILLNTVQRLLEEGCFDFAKKWFTTDPRVREWTTPAQVEISKWRDLLGGARIPWEALDTHVQTPLRVLLQEATYIRNNAVHRNQVLVGDILKMLTSSIQLTKMLRDQARCTAIESIRDRLIDELNIRDNNRARATAVYRESLDDIDRRKEPLLKKLDKLRDEEDDVTTAFEKDSVRYDNNLQSSVVKFINQVIHTGEEIARITPTTDSAPNAQPEGSQEIEDEEVQFISKTDFEVATLGSRKLEKKSERSGSKDGRVFVKQDHAEDLLSSIHPTASSVGVQSTPASRNSNCTEENAGSSSNRATPRATGMAHSHPGTEPEDQNLDSPSRQLELEANMANGVPELAIDGYDILGSLDAELDNQLLRTQNETRISVDSVLDQMNGDVRPSVEEPASIFSASPNFNEQNDTQPSHGWTEPCVLGRRVPSPELGATDRSFAPSPDVGMSEADTANCTTADTTTADSANANGSINLRKDKDSRTTAGSPAVEFGKPWKPATNVPVSSVMIDKSQGEILRTTGDLPFVQFGMPSKSIVTTQKSKQVNLNNIHLWRKRKAASPLGERAPTSCNEMISTRPNTMPAKPNFPTSVTALPTITSFGDVAKFAKPVGFNPPNSTRTGASETNKLQEIRGRGVVESRQAATWEGRRILVGCLSFTPSKVEVERLFLGYNVTRVDFPELWIMGTENRPAGGVFVDLATAAQAKLAVLKLSGEEPKIRNCRVSIMLASDPWKLPPQPHIKSPKKKKKKKTRLPSSIDQPLKKSEPIGKRTGSYYADMRQGLSDDQNSKRRKLVAGGGKDTTALT